MLQLNNYWDSPLMTCMNNAKPSESPSSNPVILNLHFLSSPIHPHVELEVSFIYPQGVPHLWKKLFKIFFEKSMSYKLVAR